jgi:uncharacterized protein DUF732
MLSGIIRYPCAVVAAVALASAAAVLPGDPVTADPGQDQKFFDLLGEKDIPPVDNANSLIETARKACSKLDGGMSVGDLVDLIRNNGYNENPLTRLNPPGRITDTINRFIIASVEAYCPADRGKIASIMAYRTTPPGDAKYRTTAYGRSVAAAEGLLLASFVGPVPAGEIAPTKPVPVPAQPPPSPEQLAPAPQEPPPPPKRTQQAPSRQQQVEPPPEQAPPQAPPPPQEPPPQAEPPQAPAPAPQPGGGSGGAPAPESPAPAPAAPPGHIRIAP